MKFSILKISLTTFLLAGVLPTSAQLLTPPWQGNANSEYAEWDLFTEANTDPNNPDVAQDAPTNDATVICTTTSAFLTSGQNLYSILSPLNIQVDDSANFPIANVLLQINVLGRTLDLNSIQLIPDDATSLDDIVFPTKITLVGQENFGGEVGTEGSGFGSTYAMQWDLSAEPLTTGYSLLFNSIDTSMSLNRVSLHTSDTFLLVDVPSAKIAPPTMTTEGDNFIFSWPQEGGTQLTLQESTNLNDPDAWSAVANPVVSAGLNFQVTVPKSGPARFFRLSLQRSAQ